ncbi:MAG: SH3 domain-containing protein [Clostridia bacterium]|nr:SH3 domain-containing protein [Clostridia bacterium]
MKRQMMRVLAVCALLLMLCTAAALAQTAYINNGSNPKSMLNMRANPDRNAVSLGRFYSGTQVQIAADAGGGWSKVTIGSGLNSVSGYMMTQYLSEEIGAVLDARQQKKVASPYGTPAVVLRDQPSDSYTAVTMLPVGEAVCVIGVAGRFCYVQTQSGAVGCLKSSELN